MFSNEKKVFLKPVLYSAQGYQYELEFTVEGLIYIENQPQNAAGEHGRSGIIMENVW